MRDTRSRLSARLLRVLAPFGMRLGRDLRMVPPIEHQPAPLARDALSSARADFGPFARPLGRIGVALALAPVILAVGAIAGGGYLITTGVPRLTGSTDLRQALASGEHISQPLPHILPLLGLVVGVLLLTWGLWLTFRTPRRVSLARSVRFAADPDGLCQIDALGRTTLDITWREARMFYRIPRKPVHKWPSRAVYALDAGTRQLMWAVPARPEAEELRQHDALCRLITTRTRLPLRDPTIAARQSRRRDVTQPDADLPLAAASGSAATRRATVLRWLGVAAVVGLLLAVFANGASALIGHVQAQEQQRVDLPGTIHSGATLYYDALNLNDGDWPVDAGAGSGGSLTFSGSAYQLNDSAAPFLFATAPGQYSDVAVEVTFGQANRASHTGAGLVLRQSDHPRQMLAFTVSGDGTWSLARYSAGARGAASWSVLGGDASSAIHTGPRASNRLLVVVRGADYLCYVNDQFVGALRDDADHAPRFGRVGVFVRGPAAAGAFTDFAIYPAP